LTRFCDQNDDDLFVLMAMGFFVNQALRLFATIELNACRFVLKGLRVVSPVFSKASIPKMADPGTIEDIFDVILQLPMLPASCRLLIDDAIPMLVGGLPRPCSDSIDDFFDVLLIVAMFPKEASELAGNFPSL
jgi:hypothetical protein